MQNIDMTVDGRLEIDVEIEMIHTEMSLSVQGHGHIEPVARHLHIYMLNAGTKYAAAGYDCVQGIVKRILAERIDDNVVQGAYVRGSASLSAYDPAGNAFQPDRRRPCGLYFCRGRSSKAEQYQ
jgi:hypothetical protein